MVTKNKVSLELVPRSYDSLLADALVAARYEEITHLNIPQLKRFPISSIEAVVFLRKEFGSRFEYIPHIIGKDLKDMLKKYSGTCLLVSGDEGTSVPLAERETPTLLPLINGERYVAVDQYRGSVGDEYGYLSNKIRNGATGVFTQPFFSPHYLFLWWQIIPRELEVFYGVSPVINERSRKYWEEKNNATFPDNFDFSLEGNIKLAQRIILMARSMDSHVYLMPIRVPVGEYLHGIFEK